MDRRLILYIGSIVSSICATIQLVFIILRNGEYIDVENNLMPSVITMISSFIYSIFYGSSIAIIWFTYLVYLLPERGFTLLTLLGLIFVFATLGVGSLVSSNEIGSDNFDIVQFIFLSVIPILV